MRDERDRYFEYETENEKLWQARWQKFVDLTYKYLLFMYQFKPRWVLAMLYGILASTAMPPLNWIFVLPFVFMSIMRLTDFSQDKKQAYKTGLGFSFGYGLGNFYWISIAVTSGAQFAWLLPFAAIGIPLVYAIFNAFAFYFYFKFSTHPSAISKTVIFALFWCLFEFLRGYSIIDFPWGFLGYSFAASTSLMQIASVIGVFGCTVFIVVFSCGFHLLLLNGDPIEYVEFLKYLIVMTLVFIGFFVFGKMRLASNETEFRSDVNLLLVQGNNERNLNWTQHYADSVINKYGYLTRTYDNIDNITHIIWPESAVPDSIYNKKELRTDLSLLLHQDQTLITGSTRYEINPEKEAGYEIFNSMSVLNGEGDLWYYDKYKLVPFGEYIPFKNLLPFVKKVTSGMVDISPGDSFKVIKDAKNTPPFTPLICYESIFSASVVRPFSRPEAKWIVNITNDSWFGMSSGPFQHFEMARFRAIEQGLPVARVASTGITGIIDSYGRVLASAKLGEQKLIETPLPTPHKRRTLFSIFGNSVILIIVITYLLTMAHGYLYDTLGKRIANFINNMIVDKEVKRKLKGKPAQKKKEKKKKDWNRFD